MNDREKAQAAFRAMGPREKAGYIFDYYKFPILLALLALIILITTAHQLLTRKETVLYLGLVNVSVGTDLEEELTDRFLAHEELSERKNQVYVYSGLYLSENPSAENHEYAYASRLKVLAAINAKQLDVVLMNQEGYDLLSQSGYLLNLTGLLPNAAESHLTDNTVVLADNATEVRLGEADVYEAETRLVSNGVEVSSLPLFQTAGFSQPVYFGIIANSPRVSQGLRYLEYLLL